MTIHFVDIDDFPIDFAESNNCDYKRAMEDLLWQQKIAESLMLWRKVPDR